MNKFGINDDLMKDLSSALSGLSALIPQGQMHGINKDFQQMTSQLKKGEFDEKKIQEIKDKYASNNNL